MPDINQISQGARYVGSRELGGYAPTAIELDVKPIQQLAQYTFLYNKSQYDQAQKDTDAKIAKLAELAPYDLMNGLAKDVDEVKKLKLDLEQFSRKYLSKVPRTPQEKLDQEIEFNTNKRDTLNKINSANQRAIKFVAETNRINNDAVLSLDEKALELEDLKKQFDNTDILTPITSVAKVDIPDVVVAKPIEKTVTQIVRNKDNNGVTEVKSEFFDVSKNRANAYAERLGLFQDPLPANATEEQKRQYKINQIGNKKNKFWQQAGENYNAALLDPKYSKVVTDPVTLQQKSINEVDLEKVKSNPLIQGQVELINRYNAWATQKKADVEAGLYKDFIDPKTKLVTTVTADEFQIIDPTKPLQPEDLIFLEKFRLAAPDKVDKDYKSTGLGIQRENNLLDYKVAWYNATHKPEGGKEKSPDVIDKPAILFGQHIERLKNRFAKDPSPIEVKYSAVDDKTRIAAKMGEGDAIVYKSDGSFIVKGSDGVEKSSGTIENLAQGFIDAVKVVDTSGGADKDGTMAEGFQTKSENYFKQLWGTTSGKDIWDNWGVRQSSATPQTTAKDASATTTTTDDTFIYNGAEGTYQQLVDAFGEDEVKKGIKSNLIKVKKKK